MAISVQPGQRREGRERIAVPPLSAMLTIITSPETTPVGLADGQRCAPVAALFVVARAALEDGRAVTRMIGLESIAAGVPPLPCMRAGCESVNACSARRGDAAVSKVKSVTVAGGGEGESHCDGPRSSTSDRGRARGAPAPSAAAALTLPGRKLGAVQPAGTTTVTYELAAKVAVRTAKAEGETVASAARHRGGG